MKKNLVRALFLAGVAGAAVASWLFVRPLAQRASTGGDEERTVIELVKGTDGAPVDPDLPGGVQLLSDGRKVWPPQGPGCDRYVACCNAAKSQGGQVGMACQMIVALAPVDCAEATRQLVKVIQEMGKTVPLECNPR